MLYISTFKLPNGGGSGHCPKRERSPEHTPHPWLFAPTARNISKQLWELAQRPIARWAVWMQSTSDMVAAPSSQSSELIALHFGLSPRKEIERLSPIMRGADSYIPGSDSGQELSVSMIVLSNRPSGNQVTILCGMPELCILSEEFFEQFSVNQCDREPLSNFRRFGSKGRCGHEDTSV